MKRAVLFALLFAASCAERDEPLVNGYRFVELSRGTGAIVRNSDFAVHPNVTEYEVRGSLVIGRRIKANDNSDHSPPFTEGLGYFVLDTSTGALTQGLPEKPAS